MIIDDPERLNNSPLAHLRGRIINGISESSIAEGRRIAKTLNQFGGIDRINEGLKLAEKLESAQMEIFSNDYLPDYKRQFENIKPMKFKPREINVTVEIHNCDCKKAVADKNV